MIQRQLRVADPAGIHAIVAQELAQLAERFASSLFLRHGGRTANLGRVVEVLALGVRGGAAITVLADGVDETAALEAVAVRLMTGDWPAA